MKKVLLSALVSLGFVGTTLADAPSPAFNGFYLGGGLTYSNGKINNKVNTNNQVKFNSSSKGVGFNVFTGYGALVQGGLYLGGELGLGFDGSRFKNKSIGAGSTLTWKSTSALMYSIAARLGYAISDVLPYVKVGVEGRSSVKLKMKNGNTAQFNGKDVSVGRSGFILGAGIDYAITKNAFLRAEYTHNFGSKSTYSVNNIKVADFRMPTDAFLFGAAYKF